MRGGVGEGEGWSRASEGGAGEGEGWSKGGFFAHMSHNFGNHVM